jgi:hypothetical protein
VLEALRILTDDAGMPVFRELLAVGGNACKRGKKTEGEKRGGKEREKISGELLAEGGNASKKAKI